MREKTRSELPRILQNDRALNSTFHGTFTFNRKVALIGRPFGVRYKA